MMAGEEDLWDLHIEPSVGGVMSYLDSDVFVLRLVVAFDCDLRKW